MQRLRTNECRRRTVERSGRTWTSAVVSCVVLVVALVGTAGAADTSPPTAPGPTQVPTTRGPTPVPASVPPTASPGPSPSDPAPTTSGSAPADPTGEPSVLGPDQTVATETEVATLTESQRALIRQLQGAKDTLAVRRFALVALARQVAGARDRLDAARAAETLARTKVEETLEQLRIVKDEIHDLAAAAYRNNSSTWALGSISSLDTSNANTLARAQTYARSDGMLLAARVEELTALEHRLRSEQRVAEAARAEAEASAADLEASLSAQTQAFDDATAATTKAQTALARGLGSGASLLARILDPRFAADDISASLAAVQAGQGEPPTLDGIFALPMPGARLNSHFGIRIDPIAGTIGFHSGVDFEADARTPIHAAAAGLVIVAGDCGGYGSCVVIDHGASLATIYGHQSAVLRRVGDGVAAGEVVGLVGSTGISTGPHLHFEVRLHGAPIDPVPTLSG